MNGVRSACRQDPFIHITNMPNFFFSLKSLLSLFAWSTLAVIILHYSSAWASRTPIWCGKWSATKILKFVLIYLLFRLANDGSVPAVWMWIFIWTAFSLARFSFPHSYKVNNMNLETQVPPGQNTERSLSCTNTYQAASFFFWLKCYIVVEK